MLNKLYTDTITALGLTDKEVFELIKEYTASVSDDKLEAQRTANNKRRALKNVTLPGFELMTSSVLPVSKRTVTMELQMSDGRTIVTKHEKVFGSVQDHMKLGDDYYLLTPSGLIHVDSPEYREHAIKRFIKGING